MFLLSYFGKMINFLLVRVNNNYWIFCKIGLGMGGFYVFKF